MDLDSPVFVFLPIAWIAFWIGLSILYQKRKGKALFPRVPPSAVFAEAWRSGSSLKNILTRLGGARNCLLIYIADGELTIRPIFPFNLMFLAEIYGLDVTVPISEVHVASVDGVFGKRLRLTVGRERFDLWLKDEHRFQQALEGKANPLSDRPAGFKPARRRLSWRLRGFQIFAVIWGVFAAPVGFSGLADDLRFRSHGIVTAAKVVEIPSGDGAEEQTAPVQYEVAGKHYALTSEQGSGVLRPGGSIRYLREDPTAARADALLSFDLLFATMGSIMLTLGLSFGWVARRVIDSLNLDATAQPKRRA